MQNVRSSLVHSVCERSERTFFEFTVTERREGNDRAQRGMAKATERSEGGNVRAERGDRAKRGQRPSARSEVTERSEEGQR